MPRSRANDQNCREAEASMPTEVVIPIVVMIEPITAVPATESVACRKISMNGYPVAESRALSMSPRQKSMANNMPKPREPLISTDSMIDVGTAVEAFKISSDIYSMSLVSCCRDRPRYLHLREPPHHHQQMRKYILPYRQRMTDPGMGTLLGSGTR